MSTTITSKRLSAVLAFIVAFAVAAVMAISPAAFAADNAVGNIDTTQEGTLHVHKYMAPTTGATADGSELAAGAAPSADKALNKVEFTVYKISGIDLTKSADWKKLKNLTIADNGDLSGETGVAKGAKQGAAQKTATGVATFSHLPFGAYVVVETDNSQAEDKDGNPTKVTKSVKPFIVTIPFPTDGNHAGTKGWLYDVHVYPKNEITNNPSKELGTAENAKLAQLQANSELLWNISIPVPVIQKTIDKFIIHDTLKNGTTTTGATAPTVKIEDVQGDQLADSDYAVAEDSTTHKVTITFNAAGLAKINTNKGKKVLVGLYVKLGAALTDNYVVNDEYGLTYSEEGDENDIPSNPPTTTTPPGTPGNPPTAPIAYFGDFKLHKVSSVVPQGGTKENLKGAQFSVFGSQTDAENNQNAILTGLESDADGIVKINDLYRGKTEASTNEYWVRETKAPAGFQLPDGAKAVMKITVTKTSGNAQDDGQEFENTPFGKDNMPELPLTGAAGKVLLTLGGIAIVMLAAGTVLATRRRKA